MRTVTALVVASLAAGVLSQVALAGSQGDAVTTTNGYNGARSSLTGSGTPGSPGALWSTVAIQTATPNNFLDSVDGLIQSGEHTATASYMDDCGTGVIGVVVERKAKAGSYYCDPYFGAWGSNHRFAVVKTSSGWKGYEDGTAIDGPWSLSFSSGYSVCRGEFLNTAPSSYNFTWGPSGSTNWQISTDGGSSYSTVLFSNVNETDSSWHVGSAPTPFSIYR